MSLRQGAIEAAAGRLEDNGNHGADWWEMNCHDVSEFVLDEILDYLEANADEWDRSVSEHYKRTMDSHARHFNAWWFVAALRVGASPVLTVPGLAEENQP
jgi:hypothetical protein